MTYYFSLNNNNIKTFWSNKTVFGGGVILIAPDESHMLFKCDFVRKRNIEDCSVFKIELELNEVNKYTYNEHLRIKLANVTNKSNSKPITWTVLHNSDDFDDFSEEPHHYYHFAVNLNDKLKLTEGKYESVKSIRIVDILKNNGTTIEFSLFDEKMMFRPDGTVYYVYSVKIPDKYLESFYLEKNSFTKLIYSSNIVTGYKQGFVVIMYRSINGPKGLKDSMGLEERGTSLKNFWQPEAKPWNFITTKPECDFIPYYSEADSKINRLEVLKEMGMFESDNKVRIPEIKEVIFNYPATIVCWKDGSKTIVKCGKDEHYDREKAVTMCIIKKMLKPSKKCHWLDIIHDAIKAAEEKEQRKAEARDAKVIKKATNKAKAEQAKKNTAELQAAIQKLETKSLEEMNSKVEGKDEFEEKYKDIPVKQSKKESNTETLNTIAKENDKAINKGKKNKIDLNVLVDCIKEDLTIDEIAEMNSWDKAAVARLYYKMTGTRPKKKDNTYSELDNLFEQGVSVDAAARRTGFSKNIVAMRYAKLQGKKSKE